eukprot:gene45309-56435_t
MAARTGTQGQRDWTYERVHGATEPAPPSGSGGRILDAVASVFLTTLQGQTAGIAPQIQQPKISITNVRACAGISCYIDTGIDNNTREETPQQHAPGASRGKLKMIALSVTSALLVLAGGSAQALGFVATPLAQPVVSAAGIKHPALGFTLQQLEYARTQTRADVEPYKTYYNIMATVCCNYANINLQPTNRDATKVDTPNTPNFNGNTAQTRIINDSQGALTQAILYHMTGQNEYRRNAMRILRTWSNMNPAGYAYYPDAHIHTGVPLFRMLAAAEIMRYTPGDPAYTAYPLAWTDTDTQKLKDNLIDPMERTFFASKERFMNQHLYSLIGRMAGAIFTDNRARYDETVEWMTVNASSTRQDINGAMLPTSSDQVRRFSVSLPT